MEVFLKLIQGDTNVAIAGLEQKKLKWFKAMGIFQLLIVDDITALKCKCNTRQFELIGIVFTGDCTVTLTIESILKIGFWSVSIRY